MCSLSVIGPRAHAYVRDRNTCVVALIVLVGSRVWVRRAYTCCVHVRGCVHKRGCLCAFSWMGVCFSWGVRNHPSAKETDFRALTSGFAAESDLWYLV